MFPYLPHTEEDVAAMLAAVGAGSLDDLFEDIPAEVRLDRPLDLPEGRSEAEVRRVMETLSRRNDSGRVSFLGAGIYDHLIPATVPHLVSRSEFYTSYTPYQAEISQGVLQGIFEFQTLVCELTGLEVSNASLYDGASAAAEAAALALNSVRGARTVLVSATLHPFARQVLATRFAGTGVELVEVEAEDGATSRADLERKLEAAGAGSTAAFLGQSPNVFGVVEDWSVSAEAAHAHGALAIGVVNEMFSLALLTPPGHAGIDIACGEAASFGVAASFGGPLIGFLSCRDAFKRQIPGRLAGRLETPAGPVFALTLSTREQHIRREKATSNICSNQGLVALTATMTLTALGKHGLRETALLCLSTSEYLKAGIGRLGTGKFAVAFPGATFNEFALRCGPPVADVLATLEKKQILGGVPYARLSPGSGEHEDLLLVATTERIRREDLDRFLDVLKGF